MNRSRPPKFPTWLLDRLGNSYRRDALMGDLLEEYRKGRSNAWYWRQVLWAVVANGRNILSARRPAFIALLIWWGALLIASFEYQWPVVIFALDPSVYWLWRERRKRRALQIPSQS